MKFKRSFKRCLALAMALVTIVGFNAIPANAAEVPQEEVIGVYYITPQEAKATVSVGSNSAVLRYNDNINVTVSSGYTATSIRVIGTLDNNASSGATATIHSNGVLQNTKTFALDGQYHNYNLSPTGKSGQTLSFNVALKDGDITKQLAVAIILMGTKN